MKKSLIIPMLILGVSACSDSEYTKDDITLNRQGQVLEKESNDPIDGYLVEYYGKDIKRMQLQFEDGYQAGEATRWYRDGTVQEKGQFALNDKQRSKKDGEWQRFYQSGDLKEEVIYDLGSPIETTRWCENGTKKLYQDEKQSQQWSCKGVLLQEATYVDGQLDGTSKTWSESGKITSESNYSKGQLHGVSKQWTAEGQLISEIHYDSTIESKGFGSAAKNGSYKTWTPQGDVLISANYKNDNLDGDYIAYNEQGELIEKGRYVDGKKVGIWSEQYSSWGGQQLITKDYEPANFINAKYLKAVNDVCSLRRNPYKGNPSKDNSKCLYYLENDLIDPKKKITSYALGDNGTSDWYYLANHAEKGVYDYLKTKGVPVNTPDSNGTTRLHVCIEGIQYYGKSTCNAEEVTSLIKDFDINATTKDDGSALMLAVKKRGEFNNRAEPTDGIIKVLLENNADLDKTNKAKKTALMLALHNADFELAATLIDKGANVTLKDSDGYEAIHYVFIHSSKRQFRTQMKPEMLAVLKKMIAKGASLDTPTPDGQTLKELFIASGAVDLAKEIEAL